MINQQTHFNIFDVFYSQYRRKHITNKIHNKSSFVGRLYIFGSTLKLQF